jgi:GAF domain-containing protein
VSQDILSLAAEVLQKIVQGASNAELEQASAALEEISLAGGSADSFNLFKHHLNEILRKTQDSAVAERGLNLLIDTTHDLSSTLQLGELFDTIVTRAKNLVGANLAWVTILDDESGLFKTVTAEGYLLPETARMKSHIDHGAVGLIMKSKSFFSTQDYLNDKRFRHLPELDRIFQTENIVSLAGFPMLADGAVHGFLFVADRYSRKLSGREISVLGSFALHAGVAMRNANAFKLLSEALDEAQRNRRALIDHIQRIEESAAVHDEMTSLLASGAQLQQFLQRMANQVDGAIFLYDHELRIREEYTSEEYRGRLADQLKSGEFDPALLIAANSQSKHTGRSVVMLSARNEECRLITLHGGTGRSESLVICHQGQLDAIEIRNLERNAGALSIAKLWNEKRETEKLIASSTLLRHLLLVNPPDPSTISTVRDRLNLGVEQPLMIGLIVISGLDRAAQTATIRECAAGIDILVDLFDDAYLAMGPEPALRTFMQKLARSKSDWDAGGVLSDAFSNLDLAPSQFARAAQALQIIRKMKTLDRFLAQSDVNLFAKIFEAADSTRLAQYLQETLKSIDEETPRKGVELKRTLLCYFDNQHNLKRVAEKLGIHINTVRQRLETLRRVTGGWDDPIRALELHVALRLHEILR